MALLLNPTIGRTPAIMLARNASAWENNALVACVPITGTMAADSVSKAVLPFPSGGGATQLGLPLPIGGGVVFDATQVPNNNFATIPHNALYSLASNFTITGVAYSTASDTLRTIWCRSNSTIASGMWVMGLDGTNPRWRFTVHDGAQKNAVDTVNIVLNTPYYVVGTHDGTNIRLYVNGVLKATTLAGALGAITQGLTVGGRADNATGSTSNWKGGIFDCRYYSTVWTQNQVTQWTNASSLYWQPKRRFLVSAPSTARHQWMPVLGVN